MAVSLSDRFCSRASLMGTQPPPLSGELLVSGGSLLLDPALRIRVRPHVIRPASASQLAGGPPTGRGMIRLETLIELKFRGSSISVSSTLPPLTSWLPARPAAFPSPLGFSSHPAVRRPESALSESPLKRRHQAQPGQVWCRMVG